MWDPGDWILQGTYCPPSDISDLLDRIRQSSGCGLLLHFAVDDSAILRTLTFASNARASAATAIESDIRQHLSARSPRDRFLGYLLAAVSGDFSDTSAHAVRDIHTELRRVSLLSTIPSLAVIHRGLDGVPVRSVLIAVDAVSAPVINESLATQLAVMVNATPSAEARRDTRAMGQVRSLPSSPDGVQQLARNHFVEAALDLALAVTRSNAGALYLRNALEPQHLAVVAVRGQVAGVAYPDLIDPRNPLDQPLDDVLQRQRFIHRAAGGTFLLKDTVVSAAELLCPLPWTSAVPDGPAAGFIVLHKPPKAGSFTAYDRALVRNVSLRVGLQRYEDSATVIGIAISEMRRGISNNDDSGHSDRSSHNLPSDILNALPRIEVALPQLGRATESHSVSLRLLLPQDDLDANAPINLVQVAVYPPATAQKPYRRVLPPDTGANWTVIKTGRVVLHDDTTDAEHYTATRETTRAEVSVPVRSEGRIVGTLNLESPYVGHYRALAALVEAFGSAVGRVLADTATAHARASLSRSIAIDGLAHDLRKKIEHAISAASSQDSTNSEAVRSPLLQAASLIDQMRKIAESNSHYDSTLSDTIHSSMLDVDMVTLRHAISWPAQLDDCVVPSYQGYILRPVLVQLLTNLKDHGSTVNIGSGTQPTIAIGEDRIDDIRHAVITFTNRVDQQLNPKTVRDLYRAPVVGSSKPGHRLGAYLAGVRVRSLGGSLVGTIPTADLLTFQTILTFPLAASND